MGSVAKSAPLLALLILALGAGNAPAAEPKRLPLSLLDVMRASVEIPANGIWAAEGNDKLTEEDWRLADQDAVNLIVASTLIARPGTGRHDAKWVGAADWRRWVRDMAQTSLKLRKAVKATDPKAMMGAADHLQQICEACHTKYRPKAPSDGVARYPFYPKRELIR
jgi:hypothetical protein